MRCAHFVAIWTIVIASLVTGSANLFGQENQARSLYGGAHEAPVATLPKFALHGTNPDRSALVLLEKSGTCLYLTRQGFYRLRQVTYVRDLYLDTPWGTKPGWEYKNEGADPTMPQTFWISRGPINGNDYVVAYSDAGGNWYALTENCVGRPVAP